MTLLALRAPGEAWPSRASPNVPAGGGVTQSRTASLIAPGHTNQERRRAALAVPRRPVNQLHGTDQIDESRENKGENL